MMTKHCDYEVCSNVTRTYIMKAQEPEDFLQFFKNGFIILNGKRIPLDQANENIKKGSLFRIQAPYGHGARCIQ